ncbi:hypothetical protein Bca52824_035935 [Brassica carinata]|uniref:Uncharacterized protein n=1 Tax=Brassica carinata TaxID=52824 RepID=A0A8X7S561_BRACI|nr:hypothetical protein Bca52824_035935 [Brassica carinata]
MSMVTRQYLIPGQTPHAKRALQICEEGAPPTLARLYKLTHQHADGTFSHPRRKLRSDVEAGLKVGLGYENPGGARFKLYAIEQDKILSR